MKDLIFSYSLLVLDEHPCEALPLGWTEFVKIVDICWRPILAEVKLGKLCMYVCSFISTVNSTISKAISIV